MSNYNCLTMMILRKCRANYEELTSLINNQSNILIAVYDKSRSYSGTAKTVAYARKQGLEIIEIQP